MLDTDTRDLVSMHTDGNEIISVVKYSPGALHVFILLATIHFPSREMSAVKSFVSVDGAYLAVGSHDNFVYIYSVTENGRKYSRVGKCTVSLTRKPNQRPLKFIFGKN